ncbi:MAG: alpha-amylase, partial [Candidatus Marinimicrobia bacterium]|nr:alpha-amylase [Candidatus Neomarinimicrobiota bacterium]
MKHLIYLILGLTLMTTLNASERTIKHPDWSRNASIYEVNIRQFSLEGTFAEFEKYLPELQKMGVKIIWLMPIHPIGELNRKGTLGSYYSVKDYKEVNPEFGTKEDFRRLVKRTHELGMYIIIDWVANHSAWDNVWTSTNPDFYSTDSDGNYIIPVADWTDVIDLNYDNPELRKAMIDALVYWIKAFDIDGYRCDVAALVPTDFWETVRDTLDKIKPVFMLAEAHEPELQVKAFDMTYAWQYKYIM